MAKTGLNKPSLASSLGGLRELKKRLLFIFIAVIVYRIGVHIPVPGLDPERLAHLFNQKGQGILGLFNLFSGGALSHFTVFALGLLPYISVSIIVQLLSVIVPSLEQLKKEGEAGRRKLNQYTRYGAVLLAITHGFALSKWIASHGVALNPGAIFYCVSVLTLVTGALFLMWLGEQMSERGVGSGTSLIIFAGIVSGLPSTTLKFIEQMRQGQIQVLEFIFIAILAVGLIVLVVMLERAQRKIPVHYPQRQQGRRMYSAQTSHLPLKINMSGVMPPIFASSLMVMPGMLLEWLNHGGTPIVRSLALYLSPGHPVYLGLLAIAIVFFSFFYTALVYNPRETSDNLKKSGAFILGIRPGEQSARYIDSIMTRLTLVGCLYLLCVVLTPDLIGFLWDTPFKFGGTSLLIVVGVVMEFIEKVQSLMMSRQYESLLKKSNLKLTF